MDSRNTILFAVSLIPFAAFAADTKSATSCVPAPPIRAPAYPPDLAIKGINGTVVLTLIIDDCGRVLDAKVKTPDRPTFNKAALASVKGASVVPSLTTKPQAGETDYTVSFNMNPQRYEYREIDWPKSHARPRYELQPSDAEFADAAAVDAAFPFDPANSWKPPYPGVRSRFIQTGTPEAREFWLVIFKDREPNLAAHYRPVMKDGEPVVQLSVLCSDTAANCNQATTKLLEGLPNAKAR
ncbi:TonB family protein [Lysobacter sp. FW306-1B-D06B]|uniref:TonB family protein n=1 Tax=Lysobacter sp. FW306-1B-D06B TaxID=3140250 RepID=UPI00313FE827